MADAATIQAEIDLSAGHPEKQGLKQQLEQLVNPYQKALSGSSRKTRIETSRLARTCG